MQNEINIKLVEGYLSLANNIITNSSINDRAISITKEDVNSDYIYNALLLREIIKTKGIYISINPTAGQWEYECKVITKPTCSRKCQDLYNSYEEALLSGIDKALKMEDNGKI